MQKTAAIKTFTFLALLSALPAAAYIDSRSAPLNLEGLLKIFEQHPEATTLDQVPALLPDPFLVNFTLKHGLLRKGERGHLVETKISQSSDPQAPRAILWDERSGFTVSYNGGLETQKAAQRLDIMSFDANHKAFSLSQIDFPIQPGKPAVTTSDCINCHGPSMRPIFAMYPDWPSFYGSDNDELKDPNKAVQKSELADYLKFRKGAASTNPRYQPLFVQSRVKQLLGTDLYSTFPYRPDINAQPRATSRSFAFRASLRAGILYNRLNSQVVAEKITKHERYAEFGPLFLFNLLQCKWTNPAAFKGSQWPKKLEAALGEAPRYTSDGSLLNYRQLLKLFDLSVNEVDIRYSYDHEGYKNEDASKNVMQVGYIGRFWNSYFDGSATIDELVSHWIYQDLAQRNPSLKGKIRPDGLVRKYAHLSERFRFDENFFKEMDAKGVWIPIPYPAQLASVQHRESYTPEFATQHAGLCRELESNLK